MGKQKQCTVYDRLIGSYYGDSSTVPTSNRRGSDRLGGFYGNAVANVPRSAPAAPMSTGDDEGWVQPRRPRPGSCSAPNTYARGSGDLENRFGAMPSSPRRTSAPGGGAMALSLELERRREFSRPFYDTGEHVLVADVSAGTFHVGQSPGVELSYGQIVAMGDLYDTVDDMMNASVAELTRLKAMIVSDTKFYAGKKTDKALGISNIDWGKATGGRFLKLAEQNYEHFSPTHVAMGSSNTTAHWDNQAMWRIYHKRAIDEANKMYLASSGHQSLFYEWPLIINAFGDHFLTDAFAAGHLINKDAMIDLFKKNFYKSSDTLSKAGDAFFEAVAKEAWWGMVSYKFSKLETSDTQINIPWTNVGVYHADIDTPERLAKVLIKAAEQQPDRIGNLLVKTLHDYLNDNGVEVSNDAGDGAWYVPGDGSLMVSKGRLTPANATKNFNIIRKAVQQSIDDITGDLTHMSNLDYSKFTYGVWKYAPVLTSAGQKEMSALIRDYSSPSSQTLIKAAADLIHSQLEQLLEIMVKDEKKLRPN